MRTKKKYSQLGTYLRGGIAFTRTYSEDVVKTEDLRRGVDWPLYSSYENGDDDLRLDFFDDRRCIIALTLAE